MSGNKFGINLFGFQHFETNCFRQHYSDNEWLWMNNEQRKKKIDVMYVHGCHAAHYGYSFQLVKTNSTLHKNAQ